MEKPKKLKMPTTFDGQIDLMAGLNVVTKKEFVSIFCQKYKTSKRQIALELTAINRDFGIGNYHNKGFIFTWGQLINRGRNWGKFYSSFNIDNPLHVMTICDDPIPYHDGAKRDPYAIHCNIYKKPTYFQLPSVVHNNAMRICYYGAQDRAIEGFVKLGKIYAALEVGRNMFNQNVPGDGLWGGFTVRKCKICDEQINGRQEVCAKCRVE